MLTLAFLGKRRRWRFAAIAMTLNLVMAITAYHWPDLLRLVEQPGSARLDPYKRARGWQELAEQVRPHLLAHPDAVLVGNDRELLAHLIYVLRPARHARWQPTAHVKDHYGLTTPLTAPAPGPLLFVVSGRSDALVSRFESAQKLADIEVTVHPDLRRQASVWLMHGFRGY